MSRAMEEDDSANMADEIGGEDNNHQAQLEGETDVPSSSSSSSSSSSGYSPPWRARARFELERQLMDAEGSDDEDEDEEEQSSTETDDSDEETSEEDGTDEGGGSALNPTLPDRQPSALLAAGSTDLRSRLQTFLPLLQRANAELGDSDNLVDKRVDHVSEDEEHYIEMNLGLGVLSERKRRAEDEVRLEDSDTVDDEDDEHDDNDVNAGAMQEDVLARLKGERTSRVKKRKIEDLG